MEPTALFLSSIPISDEPVALIQVGARPSGIQKDANGDIWVLCSGKGFNFFPAPGDTPGKLVCIDPVSLKSLEKFPFLILKIILKT